MSLTQWIKGVDDDEGEEANRSFSSVNMPDNMIIL